MGQGKLKRQLGLLDLTFLGLGAIIGSGWLFAAQGAANDAGPSAWIAWVIGAIAVGLIGLVYAEMGGALPRAGGIIRYPDYSHGPAVAYLMGFAAIIAYSSVAGIEAEAMRQYLQAQWLPGLGHANDNMPSILGWIVQFLLLFLFFLVNYWSVNVFGKLNSVITALKFIVPTLAVIIFFTHFQASNFSSHGFAIGSFTGIEKAVAASGIVFAFLGFRQAVDFAGEAKNPQKTVPLAIILAIAIGAILYILLQIVFIGAVPNSALSGGWTGLSYKAPFANLATALGLGWFATILFADAALSPSGTANIYLSSTARVIFAWARTGTFFKGMTKVDAATGVPRPALWLSFILSVLWTLPFPSWQNMVSVVSSATVMTYLIGPVSAASFRKNAASLHRPFRLGGLSVIAPLAFIIAALIIYWTGWNNDQWLLGVQIVVFLIYLALKNVMPTNRVPFEQQIKSAIWLVVFYIGLFIISYLGDKGFGGTGAISSPVDVILVIIIALIAFYWGVASALPTAAIEPEETEETVDVTLSTF